ncbi:hypothetical protein [Thermosynechococcus sp.]|uniref:hypothetical protein n=1 Tax=Thermosynechococcus sp. TaxID=2814275 RepID=UPI00391BD007
MHERLQPFLTLGAIALGQVLQLLLLLFGTFAFGALIGKFSSYFVTQALAQTLPMKSFSNPINCLQLECQSSPCTAATH